MINPARLLVAMTRPGQPGTVFQAFEESAAVAVGHRLFTLLLVDGNDVVRLWSNRPEAYPIGGRKPMGPTAWGAQVLTAQRPFFGPDVAAIRWAFFDHAVIEGMGLGSCLSVPVVYDGVTLGAMSLLHEEGFYQQHQVPTLAAAAPLLIPGFLQARARVTG